MRECGLQRLEEILLVHVPRSRDVPCRQPAGAAAAAEHVGTLVTDGSVEVVLALIRVGAVSEEGSTARVGVAQSVIVHILLLALLEELVDVEGNL